MIEEDTKDVGIKRSQPSRSPLEHFNDNSQEQAFRFVRANVSRAISIIKQRAMDQDTRH